MRVVVSSNCQTGGLAAGIKAIFPAAEVIAIALPSSEDLEKTNELINLLHWADIWITGGRVELAKDILVEIIKAPAIVFSAFHPDLMYARKKSTNELTTHHYNSRIAVWAYSNQVLPVYAAKLFNYQSYKLLGYLDSWNDSVKGLKKRFELCGYSSLEFDIFFNRVKRCGLFMHSINHPHVLALVELAKLMGKRLGGSNELINREILIPDGLTGTIWPLYTEIGDDLAINGNYIWRLGNNEIEGIENYLEFVYFQYKEQGIQPMDLIPALDTNTAAIDSILGSQL